MSEQTKAFPLRVLLTVTTGRLLTKGSGERDNGIGDLYEILGWMTNDQPFTHQLPRFGEECKPWLLRWFPELEAVNDVKQLSRLTALLDDSKHHKGESLASAIDLWLDWMKADCKLKDEYDVPRIPPDDHEHKHPYDELVAMRGTDEGIVLVDRESREVR